MKAEKFDVIVIGVGAMGSSACHHLAETGARVLGLEQFGLAHSFGSSHGHVRLIRKAYFEHLDYVPLLQRAYELWDNLDDKLSDRVKLNKGAKIKEKTFHRTGVLIVGPENKSAIFPGIIKSAHLYKVKIEDLNREEIKKRFPLFHLSENQRGIFEPDAGFLKMENIIKAHVRLSQENGAQIRFHEKVLQWKAAPSGVTVTTTKGTYISEKLVIAGGPWMAQLLYDLKVPLKVKRVPQFWFPENPKFSQESGFPCFAFEREESFVYGFPSIQGQGIKIAEHQIKEDVVDPDTVRRTVDETDRTTINACLLEQLPAIESSPLASSVCMYTMTPDENFVIDRHPQHRNVIYASCCSGHGFKFSSVIGEILSELALKGRTRHPISFLRFRWGIA